MVRRLLFALGLGWIASRAAKTTVPAAPRPIDLTEHYDQILETIYRYLDDPLAEGSTIRLRLELEHRIPLMRSVDPDAELKIYIFERAILFCLGRIEASDFQAAMYASEQVFCDDHDFARLKSFFGIQIRIPIHL